MKITATQNLSTLNAGWTVPSAAPEEQPTVRETHREHTRTRHREHNRPGASHLQRELKHLVRDVRQDIAGELRELEAAGTLDPTYAKDVRSLVRDFRDDLQEAFLSFGRGTELDADALEQGIGQAMSDLTAGLAALREAQEEEVAAPVEESPESTVTAPAETADEDTAETPATAPAEAVPVADPAAAEGYSLQVSFAAQLTVTLGVTLDLRG